MMPKLRGRYSLGWWHSNGLSPGFEQHGPAKIVEKKVHSIKSSILDAGLMARLLDKSIQLCPAGSQRLNALHLPTDSVVMF